MQTTYQLNTKEIDFSFFEAFQKLFPDKIIKITVEEVNNDTSKSSGLWENIQYLEKKYPPFIVDSSIDLSALANEINP